MFAILFSAAAQKQPDIKKAINEAQAMLKNLPPDQQAMVNGMIKNSNLDERKFMQPVDNVTGKSKQAREAFEKLAIWPDKKELKRGESIGITVSKLIYIQTAEELEKNRREREAEEDYAKTRDEHAAFIDRQMKAADKLNPSKPDYSKIDPNEEAPETTERHRMKQIEREKHAAMNEYEKEIDKKEKTESSTVDFEITGWKMNGFIAPISNRLGELKGVNHFATYIAPAVVPLNDIRSVQIDCELVYKKTKEKFTLRAEIRLLNDGNFTAVIGGNKWNAYQLLDQKYIDAEKGKQPGKVVMAEAYYSDGPPEGKELILILTNGFPNVLTIRIKNPVEGDNHVDCETAGFTLMAPDGIATLYSYKRKYIDNSCHVSDDICNHITVHIMSLKLETGGLVLGDFRGTLYEDSVETTGKRCINSIELQVSGEFSMSVVKRVALNLKIREN